MLILVAVTVKTVIDSGLFGHASNATKQWADAQEKEANIGNDNYIKDTVNQYRGEDDTGDKGNPLGGVRVTENTEYSSDGKTAIIPAEFTPSGLKEEQSIDNGLVIYLIPEGTTVNWTNPEEVENAQRTYDQFVWIPVADINDMYMCQSEDGTKSCRITVENGKAKCSTHNSEQMAGRLYATTYGENFDVSLTTQNYIANRDDLREPDVVTSTDKSNYDASTTYLGNLNSILGSSYGTADDFKNALQEEYNEIVKSVYENKGFYVGRYETSNITTIDGTAIKCVAGAIPSNRINWYYMYAQQKDYANNHNLAVGSTMIQGAAYDQVMKFVNTEGYDVKSTTNVGHFSSDFTTNPYQTGGRDYSTNYTGSTPYNDKTKNIFDLEGNVKAWTTEAFASFGRVTRGGSYDQVTSASSRPYFNPDTSRNGNIGSVLQLYVK